MCEQYELILYTWSISFPVFYMCMLEFRKYLVSLEAGKVSNATTPKMKMV